MDQVYSLYELRRPSELLDFGRELTAVEIDRLSPCSYWTTPGGWSKGEFSLQFDRPLEHVSRLRLESAGRLVRQLGTGADGGGTVTVNIDGVVIEQPLSERIVIELSTARQVSAVNIQSSTFVPAELGLSADRRRLGIDLTRLVFE